jgi:23S rRNA pseudouridine2604 synthase
MCSFFGYKVVRLQRIRIMNIELGSLRVGQWRELTPAEVKGLMKEVDSG